MNTKKVLLTVTGVVAAVAVVFGRKGRNNQPVSTIKTESQPQLFGGVDIEELNRLAREIRHGIYCSVDQWGFLIFHAKSKRGHQTFHTQIELKPDGKLLNLGGHFPGETWSAADEFVKRANERFHFYAE